MPALIAQAEIGTPETIFDFVQVGIAGLVIVALIMGWIWAKPSVDQLLRSIERLNTENNDLREELAKLKQEHSGCEEEIRDLRREVERERRRP